LPNRIAKVSCFCNNRALEKRVSLISTAVRPTRVIIPCALLLLSVALATASQPDILTDQQHFAREVYQELVQINTTESDRPP